MARLLPERLEFDSGQGEENFLFLTASRSTLGLIQPPTEWAQGAFPPGV
jgi:hypothetical protein